MTEAAPTAVQERIDAVDILRGFALLGVVVVNFQGMISWDDLQGAVDPAISWFIEHFIGGKFYRLFAFLFGLGFALQMSRLESRGVRFVPLYLRRLGILFVIGVVHGILVWPEDILALFAQFALLLLLIRRASGRTLLVIGIACLLATNAYYYVSTGFADFRGGEAAALVVEDEARASEDQAAFDTRTDQVRASGNLREIVALNTEYFLRWHLDLRAQFAILGEEFLMMLIGFYVGRRRIPDRIHEEKPLIRKAMWSSLAIALLSYPAISLTAMLDDHAVHGHLAVSARVILRDVQPAALALFYASALALLLQLADWKRRLRLLAPLGRMALTSYVSFSVIITTLYLGYGLDLYGKVSVAGGAGLALTTYFLMLCGSAWWFRRYRFGPLEWIWRSLTYGQRQQLNRHD